MTWLSIQLFGGFAVTLDGAPVAEFDSNKVRALLAYLAVESERAHRRESLAALLWPGYPDRSARTNLRNALANLRTAISDREADPPFLLITRETLQFNRASDHWLDVARLGDALSSAEHAATDQLAEAAALYTGDFLAGFTLEDAVGFDDWTSVTGERLRRQALELLGKLVDRLEAAGELGRALGYARRRVELEPWLEAAQCQLIRLLAVTGQRSAALRQYRECVRVLGEELGAEPSAETVALYEELRAKTRAKVSDAAEVPITSVVSRLTMSRPPAFLDDSAEALIVERQAFVGREPGLARLADYLDAALTGQGKVAFIVGGPGRGKSSLMRAFAEQAMVAHPDLLVVSGACNAYSGVGDAYLPFREALGMLTGDVESRWRAGRISRDHAQRLWSALSMILPALVEHGPHVIDALVSGSGLMSRTRQGGLEGADWLPELQALAHRAGGSGLAQQALFQQVTNVLCAVSAEYPLLLVLDDLQWMDQGSIGLLFHLARRLVGSRILVVGAYRPEEIAVGSQSDVSFVAHPLAKVLSEFRRDFGDVWIDLREADEAEGRRFVDVFVDAEPNSLGVGFREALYERTGGHPLFTVELLRALQERGDIMRDAGGAWTMDADLDWGRLPARVEAVIQDRLGRLNSEQRDLLAVASVEGEVFTLQVIALVQGLGEREVLRILSQDLTVHRRLVREIEEVAVNGGFASRFGFAHALFQEHLYRGLGGVGRRLLHREVGSALERLYGERRDRIVAQLAYHFDQAGDTEKAIEYAVRAGDSARLAYGNDEAGTHYARALSLLKSTEVGAGGARWRLVALSGLGKICLNTGRVSEAEIHFREAIEVGREVGQDPQELAILYHWLGEALTWQCRYVERVRIGREGMALFENDARSLGAALMNQLVAWGFGEMADCGPFFELTLKTSQFIRDLPYTEELMPAYSQIFHMQMWRKDTEAAMAWNQIWREKATQAGDSNMALRSSGAPALGATGELSEAIDRRLQSWEANRRSGDAKHESWSQVDLATLCLATGGLEQATRYADGALALSQSVGYDRDIVFSHCLVGQAALCRGDWRRATSAFRAAESAYVSYREYRSSLSSLHRSTDAEPDVVGVKASEIALSYRICENCIIGLVPYLMGQACIAGGDTDRAQVHFDQSLHDLADDYGGRDVAFMVLPALAGLEASLGSRSAFQGWCRQHLEDDPRFARVLQLWYLVPSDIRSVDAQSALVDSFDSVSTEWVWEDPFGDCARIWEPGLEIRAANGRHIWHANLSAPRFLRPLPTDTTDVAVQVACEPALDDRPAIGGLLLWRGKRDYLWLEVGRFGKRDVAFGGCLDNRDLVIGRGRLPTGSEPGWAMGEMVTLRLEVTGDRVEAFCSLDGEAWYSVGHSAFPVDDTVQVGVHAIGMIDRTIYHGAYPEGTAIRFTDFRLWGTSEVEAAL